MELKMTINNDPDMQQMEMDQEALRNLWREHHLAFMEVAREWINRDYAHPLPEFPAMPVILKNLT
jgi:hypothetical protein